MRPWRFLLFILLISFTFEAFPAVFVVTSNADSGPGTLREALTLAAANGSATIDYINFNLPGNSEAARTIALQNQLPDVTSNLVIDGTTQPGTKFGVSDAKVKITNTFVYKTDLNTFYSDGGDLIEIYGLWLYNDMTGWGGSAFHFRNFGNIKIGAPQKGNLVEWGNIGIDTGKTCYFQNNICWTDITGLSCKGGNITVIACDKLIFGGSADAGNTMAGTCNLVYSMATKSTVDMSFNRFGTDVTGMAAPWGFDVEADRVSFSGVYMDSGSPKTTPVNAVIKNNVFADVYGASLLSLSTDGGQFLIQGNSFNTDFAGGINLNAYSHGGPFWGISTNGNVDVIIGGSSPSEKNVIAYCQDAVGAGNSGKFLVTHNSIFCYGEKPLYSFRTDLPNVSILAISATAVSGTATPNSTIELFNADCGCYHPDPKDYFTTVTADNNGKWRYNGSVSGYVMASATLNNLTGEFSKLQIDDSGIKVVNANCNNKGSITGIKSPFSSGYRWFDASGKLVGTTADLRDVAPGTYTLKVGNGGACDLTQTYTIDDNLSKIDLSNLKITNFGCNKTGSFTGIQISLPPDQFTPQWFERPGNSDVNEKKICDCTDVQGLNPGYYEFKVASVDGTCLYDFGVYEIKNTTATSIDQSKMLVQSTTCGQSTGAITDIIIKGGSGTLKYIWTNSIQQQVGTTKDLTGQPGGVYKLQVTDDTQCGPIYSTEITIPETNGITLDESKVTTSIASCSQNNGSIKGIVFTGATKFQWMDANNNVVASTADFTGAAPGVYTFTASNNFGCSKTSQPFTIGQQPPVQLPQYVVTNVASCFGGKTGSVTIATDALVKTLRWVDGQGAPAGDQPALTNVGAGTYKLYITDQNGCENLYNTYTIEEVPEFKVASIGQTVNDQCGLNTGNVNNVSITGGVPPYTYKWTDAAGKQIGTESGISNLAAGNYVLNVTDTRCGNVDIPYTITEESAEVPAPSVSDLQLCSSGNALLSVNNASLAITYRLYETGNSAHQIDEQKGGKFNINVTTNRSYFVTELTGTCESPRAEVKITVGLSALNIANTFTPNGDGINDYWKISNIESYPSALVQVFSRYGQKVFESRGYAKPFDGTMSGKKLPPGVYYYIINLNTNCNVLSGSLTIIK